MGEALCLGRAANPGNHCRGPRHGVASGIQFRRAAQAPARNAKARPVLTNGSGFHSLLLVPTLAFVRLALAVLHWARKQADAQGNRTKKRRSFRPKRRRKGGRSVVEKPLTLPFGRRRCGARTGGSSAPPSPRRKVRGFSTTLRPLARLCFCRNDRFFDAIALGGCRLTLPRAGVSSRSLPSGNMQPIAPLPAVLSVAVIVTGCETTRFPQARAYQRRHDHHASACARPHRP